MSCIRAMMIMMLLATCSTLTVNLPLTLLEVIKSNALLWYTCGPVKYQSINQSILFLVKRYIINALSAVQWNTHISLNTYIYIYSEIQHTYKHSYKAAISAQIQCFYFRHTHSHTRGRCEQPTPSLFLVIHL